LVRERNKPCILPQCTTRNAAYDGRPNNSFTLIISTSWSTPLSPGNSGCNKEGINLQRDMSADKEKQEIVKSKKLPVQEAVLQAHNQQTRCR